MRISATCPSCGGHLSEASVLALAPMCDHCGAVITSVGGTLGLTSAYGVSDQTITRRRVEADLEVLQEYQSKYRGMLEDCKQHLAWPVERYAKLPPPPELLKLKEFPPLEHFLLYAIPLSPFVGMVLDVLASLILYGIGVPLGEGSFFTHILVFYDRSFQGDRGKGIYFLFYYLRLVTTAGFFICVGFCIRRVKAANGKRPEENVRRLKAYEEAKAVALRDAEAAKATEDYRLRYQIRELEGRIRTIGERESEVSRILASLR